MNLAVRQGDQALNVHQVQTAHFVGMTDWTGRGAPLHASANGKVLLAFGGAALPAFTLCQMIRSRSAKGSRRGPGRGAAMGGAGRRGGRDVGAGIDSRN